MGKNFRETISKQLRALELERQTMRVIIEGKDEHDLGQKK